MIIYWVISYAEWKDWKILRNIKDMYDGLHVGCVSLKDLSKPSYE